MDLQWELNLQNQILKFGLFSEMEHVSYFYDLCSNYEGGFSLIEFDTFVRHNIPVIAVVG